VNKRRRFKAKRQRAARRQEQGVLARLGETFAAAAVAVSFDPDPDATFTPAEIAHLRLLEASGHLRITGPLVSA
jgi:predicted component of type VI protein secretion system